jgi:hypothetical protein
VPAACAARLEQILVHPLPLNQEQVGSSHFAPCLASFPFLRTRLIKTLVGIDEGNQKVKMNKLQGVMNSVTRRFFYAGCSLISPYTMQC